MGAAPARGLRLAVTVVLGAAVLSVGPSAHANDMDPVLARMWEVQSNGSGGYRIVTRDDLFDALALDLAVAGGEPHSPSRLDAGDRERVVLVGNHDGRGHEILAGGPFQPYPVRGKGCELLDEE